MRKKKNIIKREQPDDFLFPTSPLVKKIITKIMKNGEKCKARKIIYKILDYLEKKLKNDPLIVLQEAVNNVKPELETKRRKLGGAVQQIPRKIENERGECLALR